MGHGWVNSLARAPRSRSPHPRSLQQLSPMLLEPLDSGGSSLTSSAPTPDNQTTLYPEPRLPSTVREEILNRRKSVGERRRFSAIVDDDRVDAIPPTGFRGLGLARSRPAVSNLATMVLSPVMEGREDGGDREGRRHYSPPSVGLVRSEAAHWDLSSLA